MQFEEIDKKIQEAAEKHHPAYDEKAWEKMEKLLDQHLPVKENDRRRIFLLLLIFLLIGGGSLLLLSKPWNKNPDIASGSKTNNEQTVIQKKPQSESTSQDAARPVTPAAGEQNAASSETGTSQIKTQNKQGISQSSNTVRHDLIPSITGNANRAKENVAANTQAATTKFPANHVDQNHAVEPVKETRANQNSVPDKQDGNVRRDATTDIQTKEVAKGAGATAQTSQPIQSQTILPAAQPQTAKKPIHKEKSTWLSGFALLFSAGPDVSKAAGGDLGKLTLTYGAGISYTKDRFTLRTGIYAARKIYKAGPNDYKLDWQSSSIKFEGADANCHVMEIPVSLYYNFASKSKSNWFAGAGLSSYIMKSENYNLLFKNSAGNIYPWKYGVKNKNKHYFSVLDLSAGYSLHLSKTVSLSAEPYVKIPLTGIGEGKVMLNSGGVLFTVGVRPFK
jgi:hypothetical protein